MSLNPVDALSEGVTSGINNFAIGLGNDMVNANSTNSTFDGKLIVNIATFTYNPFHDPAVQNALKESALLYVLFVIAFILIGGSYVQISRLRTTREFLGMKIGAGGSLSSFYKSVFGLIMYAPLVPFLMWLVLLFNYILCQLIMQGAISSLLFTPENLFMYLSICCIYAMLMGAFAFRTLVIGLCVGYCLLIIVLYIIPFTKKIGEGLLRYFVIIVFMQPVLLLLTCMGIEIIKFVAPFNPFMQKYMFIILGFMLFVVAMVFILGPITIMKLLGSAKNKLKLVL